MSDIDSSDSPLSRLDNKDYYIKKRINPVHRGNSAIFGDPLPEVGIIVNSPSSFEEEQHEYGQEALQEPQQQSKSRIDIDNIKIEPNQNQQQLLNSLQEKEKQEEPKYQPIEQIKIEQPAVNRPISSPIQPQRPSEHPQLGQSGISQKNLLNPAQGNINKLQSNNIRERQKENQWQRPIPRTKPHRYLQVAGEQLAPILQTVKQNTQSIQAVYNHIENLNTLLAQFKEDTSRKLQENMKVTLKEKMNEINRENSKQIKDIKNSTAKIQEMMEKNQKKIDRMEKTLEEILRLLKKE